MTRRIRSKLEFPRLLAGVTGLWMAMLVLSGCGNEAAVVPLESNLTLTQVSGLVDLPHGSPVRPETLTVRTSAGTSRVSREGSVATMIFEQGPQYAELLDNRGRTVMLAFASPGEPDISALSTAKALTYLALAGAWLKEEGRLKLLDEADTVAGFLPLLGAVQSQLTAKGYLDLDATEIQSAISSIATTAYGANAGLNAHVRPLGVIATPTTASGLSLDTAVDDKLKVENVYLRRVSLFIRRLSHIPAAGAEVEENNPFTRVDLKNITRYSGITGTIDGFFSGDVAYKPVSTEPALDIPRYPGDAKQTTYQMFAIGPGFSSHPNLNVPADIIAAQEYLELKAMVVDVFLVLVSNVALPLAGDKIDEFLEFASGNAIVADFIATLKTTAPEVWSLMQEGKWDEAAWKLFSSGYTSNTILPAIGQLTLDFLWTNTKIDQDRHDKLFNSMKGVLDKMGKLDIVLNVADTLLVFRDIANSKRIEQFIVTTTPGRVTLQAAATTIRPDETTTIDAVVQNKDPAGIYEYQWSVSPNANYWVEDRTLNGTDDSLSGVLVTRESQVNIRSLVLTDGVATISCKVFRLDGGRRHVGDGTVDVALTMSNVPGQVITNTYDDFRSVTLVYQGNDGRYGAGGGIYVDIPRMLGALDYRIRGRTANNASYRSITVREPVTNNNNEHFIASVGVVFWGNVPANMIRVWVDTFGVTASRFTVVEAEADAAAQAAHAIAFAKQHMPVNVTTRLR
jgi:hypothetical protein